MWNKANGWSFRRREQSYVLRGQDESVETQSSESEPWIYSGYDILTSTRCGWVDSMSWSAQENRDQRLWSRTVSCVAQWRLKRRCHDLQLYHRSTIEADGGRKPGGWRRESVQFQVCWCSPKSWKYFRGDGVMRGWEHNMGTLWAVSQVWSCNSRGIRWKAWSVAYSWMETFQVLHQE